MLITLATTPQSNTRLFMRGLKLYFASFKHVIGLALLFSMIVYIPQFIAITQGLSLFGLAILLGFYNLFFIVVEIISIFVFIAILWRIRCVITNEHESIFDDFKIASKKILLIIGVGLVETLILVLFLFLLFTLPKFNFLNNPNSVTFNAALIFSIAYFAIVVYIFFALIFSVPLILTENKGLFAALKKSYRLVWGNWWKVALLLITPTLLYFITLNIIQSIFSTSLTITFAEAYNYKDLLILIINVLWIALFVPLQGALLLLQLRDLELRELRKMIN